MGECKKSCGNCRYSYFAQDTTRHPTIGLLRQHCRNEQYTSAAYTEEMYLEDQRQGSCRFWAPNDRKDEQEL